jgi:sporulation protein YqfC
LSILIRKRQAQAKAAQLKKEHSARRSHPPLGALALPEDVTGNTVRVIALGSAHVLVENHSGVADVSDENIRLIAKGGVLGIFGSDLELTEVREAALSVRGRIERIELPNPPREERADA